MKYLFCSLRVIWVQVKDQGSPQKKKSSGCSLKNINLARACSLTLTLLHKICSMCGCPLSNIWHVFSLKKCLSDEQLILKANKLQNST